MSRAEEGGATREREVAMWLVEWQGTDGGWYPLTTKGTEAGARAYAYGAVCVSRIVPLYRGDPQMVEAGGPDA